MRHGGNSPQGDLFQKISILVYPNLSIILLLIFASSLSLQGGRLTVLVYHPLEAPAPAENTWALGRDSRFVQFCFLEKYLYLDRINFVVMSSSGLDLAFQDSQR